MKPWDGFCGPLEVRTHPLPPPDSGASFSSFGVFVFEIWVLRFRSRVLRFRVLGASFSRYGCLVLRSSFSTASFSKLPIRCTYRTVDHHTVHIPHNVRTQATHSTTRCTYHTVHLPHNAPTTSRTCCI